MAFSWPNPLRVLGLVTVDFKAVALFKSDLFLLLENVSLRPKAHFKSFAPHAGIARDTYGRTHAVSEAESLSFSDVASHPSQVRHRPPGEWHK
jgi:hypothetical protein